MATKRRKNRIVRKISKAKASGNLKKLDRKTSTLNRIATREGNRSVGNTALGNAVRNVKAKFNPRINLTASVKNYSANPNPTLQSLKPTSLQNKSTRIREQGLQIAQSYKPNNRRNARQLNRAISNANNNNDFSSAPTNPNQSPAIGGNVLGVQSDSQSDFFANNPSPLVRSSGGSSNNPPSINFNSGSSSEKPATSTRNSMSAKSSISPVSSVARTGSMGGSIVRPDGSENPFSDFNYSLSAEERALKEGREREADYYKKQSKEKLNREDVMRDTLRQFQGEIDATNSVFADRIQQSQLQGQDRLGMNRAENFNAGAVNSSFGNASKDRVLTLNRQQNDVIYNEKLMMLSQIENQARELGNRYFEERRAAKESGLESYISSISSAKEMKDEIATNIAFSLIDSQIDFEDVSPKKMKEIADNAGVSTQNIKKFYKEALKMQQQAALQAEQEAQKMAMDSQFNLSEGQARYDQFGNLIASRAKTFAPKSGSGSYSGATSPAAQALALQIRNGQATLANVPSALRAEVAQALNDLPNQQVIELDNVLSIIDELENNPKLGKILGPVDRFVGGVFGEAATAKNMYKQLDGILALEGRSKLKGSGAISDYESRILKEAQSALGRNLSEVEFKKQLEKVRNVLNARRNLLNGGYQTQAQFSQEPQSMILTSPTGEQFDASDLTPEELQEALNDGYTQ